jgi:hypothetical protein
VRDQALLKINTCMNIQTILDRMNTNLRPVTKARIAACSHVVEQPGLTRQHLGDQAYEAAIYARRVWIAEHCVGDHIGETVSKGGCATGKRFRFADKDDADQFGLRF